MEKQPHFTGPESLDQKHPQSNPERVMFEADLLRGGAEYTPDGVLLATKEQSDSIARELTKAEEEVAMFENTDFNQKYAVLAEAYATPGVIVAFEELSKFFERGSLQDVRSDLWRAFEDQENGMVNQDSLVKFYREAVTPLIEKIWPTLVQTYQFARQFKLKTCIELYEYIEAGAYGRDPNKDYLRAVTELMLRHYPKTPLEAIEDEVDLRRLRALEKISRITGTKQI